MAKRDQPYKYRAPGRRELGEWSNAERADDYKHTFSGDRGQRVLFDILHRLCGHAAKPMPQNGVTLERLVGRQDVAVDLLEILSVNPREITEANVRSFSHE